MGVSKFLEQSKKSGVDGFIIVDLPPEEDEEFCLPARKLGMSFIRLATPTTSNKSRHIFCFKFFKFGFNS